MFGYLLLVIAADIKLLLLSTAIRSAGSAVLWIYSTLMLQFAVPNDLLGRVLALEMALFTVSLLSTRFWFSSCDCSLHLSCMTSQETSYDDVLHSNIVRSTPSPADSPQLVARQRLECKLPLLS